MSTFGEWVGRLRKERKLTREELAARVGCSVAMLRKIESDERRPSSQIAVLIANAFGIPSSEHETFAKIARGELPADRLARLEASIHGAESRPVPHLPGFNLPLSPAPLIGRQNELARLNQLLADPQCRLLTLVGPGGIGKTRLATEFASRVRDDFEDGVYFVALAPVNSTRFVVPLMAEAIGFAFQSQDSAEPRTQLLNHLREKKLLLLLDNVEQLLKEPGIEVLSELLTAAPNVKLVVTSREPLELQNEWVFAVGGLPVPKDPHGERMAEDTSVELFLQRARRAHVGFDATTDDYPAIVRICQLVDGLPLAIELAAAWVRTLSCEEIANEVERGLDFLAASSRDLPARHRSMRAVFEHSWELLSEEERRALAGLSVFRGGFGREAAEQVAQASLAMLSALVTKSLARRTGTGSYDLHELIRQYAANHLEADTASAAETRHKHYMFYLNLAETVAGQLKGPGQQEWLRRLEQEHDNLRAALEWSLGSEVKMVGGGSETALRLTSSLRWFWRMHSYFHEGRSWLLKALEQERAEFQAEARVPGSAASDGGKHDETLKPRAAARVGLALLSDAMGDHASAYSSAEESAGIFRAIGDKQGLAEALMLMGQTQRWRGETEAGRARLEEAIALFRETGASWDVAQGLYRLGTDLADFGGDRSGRAMLEESAEILEALGDKFILASLLISRGIIAFGSGDYALARSHFDRGLAVALEINDPWGKADALTNIGCVLRVQGEYAEAYQRFEEALKVYQERGHGAWCADPLCAMAENNIVQGQLPSARAHLERAAEYADVSANSWLKVLVGYFRGLLSYHEGDFDGAVRWLEDTAALARESQYMPDLARALVSLGRALRARGEVERAREATTEALSIHSLSGCNLGIATALEGLAALAPAEQAQRAAGLFGTAEAIRTTIGAPLPPIDRPGYEAAVATVRERLGTPAFKLARKRGSSESCEEVVEEILRVYRAAHPTAPGRSSASPPTRPPTALGAA